MATALKPCCEEMVRRYKQRVRDAFTTYPVIKDLPCPVCKQIVPIRIYSPEDEAA